MWHAQDPVCINNLVARCLCHCCSSPDVASLYFKLGNVDLMNKK